MSNINFNELEIMRIKIDKIDDQILKCLNERLKIVSLIGKYKKDNHIPILQKDRMDQIINKVRLFAKDNNINAEKMEEFYRIIIDLSCALERDIIGDRLN